jgi:hypothetical protein
MSTWKKTILRVVFGIYVWFLFLSATDRKERLRNRLVPRLSAEQVTVVAVIGSGAAAEYWVAAATAACVAGFCYAIARDRPRAIDTEEEA